MTGSRAPEDRGHRSGVARDGLGAAVGLTIVVALAILDVDWTHERAISGTVVLAPFVTSVIARAGSTALVGVAAMAVAAASGAWNDNFGAGDYWLRLLVVAAGVLISIVGASARTRIAESRRRFELLASVSESIDGTATLEATARQVAELLVPAFADVAILDATRLGQVERLAVRADGPRAGEIEAWLRERPPMSEEVELASRQAIAAATTRLVADARPADLAQLAGDARDAEMIASLGTRSSLTVPLHARGRVLGALSLSVTRRSRRRYGTAEAAFAETLGNRIALALDNAGLYAELETTEAQLGAALGSLSDAVTIQDRTGRLVYANEAAARDLGFASARELLATPPQEIVSQYEIFAEDGTAFDPALLPGRRVLAGEDPPPLVLRSVHRATGAERWSVTKATAVRGRDGKPLLAVNVVEDVTEVKHAERAQRLLDRAGEALASSLDYARTLQQVADLAVPALADWCAVSLPDREGYLRQVAIAHVDPERVRLGRELARRYPARVDDERGGAEVLRTGETQVTNEISEEMLRAATHDPEHFELLEGLGMRAAIVVPLLVGGSAIGTMALVSAESGRVFEGADLELARELGRRAGIAVENARLYTERSAIAATLSAELAPRPLPELPGWDAATLYRPAGAENWVGGDFYDAVAVSGGWLVLIGDVAGRGAPAAALTALARHTLRAVAPLLDDPLGALARLNAELNERGGPALCTLACALLREGDGGALATIVCAGHPQPFLVRDGEATQVGQFGPILGALPDSAWTPVDVAIESGDVLVFYTDGVIDAVGERERFGEGRLRETLAGATGAQEAVTAVDRELSRFQHGEQADDTAVLALGRRS